MSRHHILFLVFFVLISCKKVEKSQQPKIQIAFMADVHLQDIHGEFSDSDYRGVLNPETGKYALIRTMKSQLQSTRLFNENYFAFLAALDDVAKKGIKYVVLPGDFSDDGQLLNVRGLKRILTNYAKNHGIQFIITTGNHDPVRPFFQEAGKKDFLGEGGKPQAIFSKEGVFTSKEANTLPVVITKDIAKLGYKQIANELKDFGFFPKKTDVYWETPFTNYSYFDYNFEDGLKQANLTNRNYKISYNNRVPDLSYLVEPADNLWFLAIDANVYIPKEKAKDTPLGTSGYNSASVGYNNVLTHKKHLFHWIKSVTERADKFGKTLIVFSHYPAIDFNDGAFENIRKLFGDKKMQLHRVPQDIVTKMFVDAGVKVHFGGHMHINDTGIRNVTSGRLVNVQIPSLAAYIPSYKLVTATNDIYEIETIVIDSVPKFNTLFPIYKQEYSYLNKIKDNTIWNKDILNTKTYKDFTQFHLKELVRLRFLKNDWPVEFRDLLLQSTGKDLLLLSGNITNKDVLNENFQIEEFEQWTGYDMVNDFYRLRSADELAIADIGVNKLKQYKMVCSALEKSDNQNFRLWGQIFQKTCTGEPSNHFKIDLSSNTIHRISP